MSRYLICLLAAMLVLSACTGSQDLPLYTVCNGDVVAEAAAYNPAITGEHPYRIFIRQDAAEPFTAVDQMRSYDKNRFKTDKAGDVQLVVCATATATDLVFSCAFIEKGKSTTAAYHNADFDIEIYAAQTGERLHSETLSMTQEATGCPSQAPSAAIQIPTAGHNQAFADMIQPFYLVRD